MCPTWIPFPCLSVSADGAGRTGMTPAELSAGRIPVPTQSNSPKSPERTMQRTPAPKQQGSLSTYFSREVLLQVKSNRRRCWLLKHLGAWKPKFKDHLHHCWSQSRPTAGLGLPPLRMKSNRKNNCLGDLVRLREAKEANGPGMVPATPGDGLQGEEAEPTVGWP